MPFVSRNSTLLATLGSIATPRPTPFGVPAMVLYSVVLIFSVSRIGAVSWLAIEDMAGE